MDKALSFYINGAWVRPFSTQTLAVINPATEAEICQVAMGNADDTDRRCRPPPKPLKLGGSPHPKSANRI